MNGFAIATIVFFVLLILAVVFLFLTVLVFQPQALSLNSIATPLLNFSNPTKSSSSSSGPVYIFGSFSLDLDGDTFAVSPQQITVRYQKDTTNNIVTLNFPAFDAGTGSIETVTFASLSLVPVNLRPLTNTSFLPPFSNPTQVLFGGAIKSESGSYTLTNLLKGTCNVQTTGLVSFALDPIDPPSSAVFPPNSRVSWINFQITYPSV